MCASNKSRLRWAHHGFDIGADVFEQRLQVHFLLVVAAERGTRLLAHDGHHGHVVHLRVVQAIEGVDCPRPGCGQTHADLTGELGMRAGHEGRHFLVAHTNVFETVCSSPQGAHDAVDAIARVTKNALDLPLRQALEKEVTHRLAHHGLRFAVKSHAARCKMVHA
jgi:hypothetical protein